MAQTSDLRSDVRDALSGEFALPRRQISPKPRKMPQRKAVGRKVCEIDHKSPNSPGSRLKRGGGPITLIKKGRGKKSHSPSKMKKGGIPVTLDVSLPPDPYPCPLKGLSGGRVWMRNRPFRRQGMGEEWQRYGNSRFCVFLMMSLFFAQTRIASVTMSQVDSDCSAASRIKTKK